MGNYKKEGVCSQQSNKKIRKQNSKIEHDFFFCQLSPSQHNTLQRRLSGLEKLVGMICAIFYYTDILWGVRVQRTVIMEDGIIIMLVMANIKWGLEGWWRRKFCNHHLLHHSNIIFSHKPNQPCLFPFHLCTSWFTLWLWQSMKPTWYKKRTKNSRCCFDKKRKDVFCLPFCSEHVDIAHVCTIHTKL